MTNLKVILLVVVLVIVNTAFVTVESVGSQYVPVSKRYPGLDIPGASPLVTVEVVYDATCGATVEFDKSFRQVVDSLSKSNPDKFSYKYSIQVLPYHIASFKITEAIRYVNVQKGPVEALRVLRYFLDTNANWVEQAVVKLTISSLMNNVAREVSTLTGLPYDDLRKAVEHYSANDNETRKWAKYAMGTLHAMGTPLIFVNGARLDGGTGMGTQKLIDYLTALL